MCEYLYKTTRWYDIQKIKVQRHTDSTVWLMDKTRELRFPSSRPVAWHSTFEDAKQFLLKRSAHTVRHLTKRLGLEKDALEGVRAMEESKDG